MMKMRSFSNDLPAFLRGLSVLMLVLLALHVRPALAHAGSGAYAQGFSSGLLHPLTGIDHLLMLLGAGMLAVAGGWRRSLPGLVAGAMLVGACLGHRADGGFSAMELVIAGSVAVPGLAMLLPRIRPVLLVLLPLLALVHGWAHGVEAPAGHFMPFLAGFMSSSAAVLVAGMLIGTVLQRHVLACRVAGGGLLGAAILLLAA